MKKALPSLGEGTDFREIKKAKEKEQKRKEERKQELNEELGAAIAKAEKAEEDKKKKKEEKIELDTPAEIPSPSIAISKNFNEQNKNIFSSASLLSLLFLFVLIFIVIFWLLGQNKFDRDISKSSFKIKKNVLGESGRKEDQDFSYLIVREYGVNKSKLIQKEIDREYKPLGYSTGEADKF